MNDKTQQSLDKFFADAREDLIQGFALASQGIDTKKYTLNQVVKFDLVDDILEMNVHVIEIQHQPDKILSLKVYGKTDFKNVLKLAERLGMKMSAFDKQFRVILSAKPELLEQQKEHLQAMQGIEEFFESMDQLKRPIYLMVDHYIVERISQ